MKLCGWQNGKLILQPHLDLLIFDDDHSGFKHIFDDNGVLVGVEIYQRGSSFTLFSCPFCGCDITPFDEKYIH